MFTFAHTVTDAQTSSPALPPVTAPLAMPGPAPAEPTPALPKPAATPKPVVAPAAKAAAPAKAVPLSGPATPSVAAKPAPPSANPQPIAALFTEVGVADRLLLSVSWRPSLCCVGVVWL